MAERLIITEDELLEKAVEHLHDCDADEFMDIIGQMFGVEISIPDDNDMQMDGLYVIEATSEYCGAFEPEGLEF